MIRKLLSRLILILLVLSLLLLTNTIWAQSEEAVVPTEEATATEEVVSTEEADTVIIVEGDESPLPTTDADWSRLRQLVELIVGGVVLAVGVFKGGDILTAAGKLFNRVSSNQMVTDEAMRQFQRLSPANQAKIATLIDVVDPLTKTSASDLDNNILAWVRKITTPVPAPISADNDPVG